MPAQERPAANLVFLLDVSGSMHSRDKLPLVKTAIAGGDANWGRVVMAVGKAGEPANRDTLSIGFGGHWAAREGQPVEDYDEAPVAAHLAGQEIDIEVDLGLGEGRASVWTCDLTHGYIDINADYRS